MAEFHILIPTVYPEGPPKAAALVDFFHDAEAQGFGGLWVIERLFHQTTVLDAYTTLTWAAANTRRVRLGTGVALMPIRNPALFARELGTLDTLSGGRVTLGVSLGGREEEHATMRANLRQRARRLEEGTEVLRLLFKGGPVSFSGRFFELRDAQIEPRPAQGANLPIWFGAASEPGLQRAGRLADGWIAGGGGTPEQFAANWQKVTEAVRAAGKDVNAFHNGKLFYVWVDEDKDRARQQVERYVRAYYGPRYDIENAVYGPVEACAERLRAFIDAGVQTLILGPTGLDRGQLEVMSSKLLPLLK